MTNSTYSSSSGCRLAASSGCMPRRWRSDVSSVGADAPAGGAHTASRSPIVAAPFADAD